MINLIRDTPNSARKFAFNAPVRGILILCCRAPPSAVADKLTGNFIVSEVTPKMIHGGFF
jgi:hypothetical protein